MATAMMAAAMMVTTAMAAAVVATAMMAANTLVTSSRNGFAMESGASLWLSDCCFDQRNDLAAFAQTIQIIRPCLHHQHALGPKFRVMRVSSTDCVRFLVSKLTLNGVWVPTPHFIQTGGRHSSETMDAHLL